MKQTRNFIALLYPSQRWYKQSCCVCGNRCAFEKGKYVCTVILIYVSLKISDSGFYENWMNAIFLYKAHHRPTHHKWKNPLLAGNTTNLWWRKVWRCESTPLPSVQAPLLAPLRRKPLLGDAVNLLQEKPREIKQRIDVLTGMYYDRLEIW